MAFNTQERLEEELAKIDPAVLHYFDQLLAENAPAVRKVQNVLEEPISQERRCICKSHYFQSLTSQEPLHAKESQEKRRSF